MYFFGTALLLSLVLRLWLAGFGGLHPDEAYYWTWSQNLKLGYYDGPPMIAWVMRLGQEVVRFLVPTSKMKEAPLFYAQLGIRLVPYFCTSLLTPLALGRSVEMVQRKPLRISQMAVLLTAPVFVLGPQIVTPDAPFFASWSMALFFAIKFQRSRPPDSFPGDKTPFHASRAIRMGLVLALCAYSKYTAILGALLFVITGAGLYNSTVAALTAVTLVSPHLWWNLREGANGSGILFQLQNGLGDPQAHPNYLRMLDLLATQLLFWTPIVFLGTLLFPLFNLRRFFVVNRSSRLVGTLSLWALTPVVFFMLSSIKRPAEGNWPLIGLMPALVLTLSRFSKRAFALFTLTVINLASIVAALIFLTQNIALAQLIRPKFPGLAQKLERPSRLNEFENWDKLRALLFEATKSKALPVQVESYQVLSELMFFDKTAPNDVRFGDRLKIWPEGSRRSEFNTELTPEQASQQREAPHWLIARSIENIPVACRLNQTLFKSYNDLQTFSVYRCGF